MRQYISEKWQELTIYKKISTFILLVFIVCMMSITFDTWIIKFALVDFNQILEGNSQSIQLVQALETEIEVFEDFVYGDDGVTREILDETIAVTDAAIWKLPFEYEMIGEVRYGKTWAIRNSYEVYREKQTAFLELGRDNSAYINDRYELYDMQKYLLAYAKELMTITLEVGNEEYWQKVPRIMRVPWIVIGFACFILLVVTRLARVMNRSIISPVMKLANTSKRIAENDYFVDDVVVENKDELGELVRAFNKMKYATGEYILALEEKRKTLDLLHAEELEKLEVENQLEIMKFELLKSQVNPHFLFNTLNVIAGMANLEEAETTEKMIKALSSLFRYNLKTSDLEVPLARELKVVEDYMYLQQMRFGERISYDIACFVNQERMLVPAFTFQPLVENCIIHGLSRQEEGGKIRIRILQRDHLLYIYIGDDGKGMTQEEMQLLREQLAKQKGQKEGQIGIGLGNIYRRVHEMYPGGELEVYSKEKAGTVIRIMIPQKNGERYVSSDCSR